MTDEKPTQPQQPDSLAGKQIGQFTVIEEIGRGGMATVYRATQASINRDVALKVLPKAFLHDSGFYERFTREVDVIAHLEHPHIVPIYDFGTFDGTPYIAMRLLMGGSLRQFIRSGGTINLHELIVPARQIGSALDYAHQQGIVHRDLKPGNILLDTNNNAYLSDFGIARVLNSDLTGSAIIGTPAYMSPEQAQGNPLDARADVYSMGVVLFELITGREPFEAETPIAMILKHLNERVPFISEFRTDLPHELDRVIAKATQKNPDERYSSAGAMAQAFEDAVRGTSRTVSIGRGDTEQDDASKKTPLSSHTPVLPSRRGDAENVMTVTPAAGIPRPRQQDGEQTVSPATAQRISSQKISQSLNNSAATRVSRRRIPGWVYTLAVGVVLVVVAGFVLVGPLSVGSDTTATTADSAPVTFPGGQRIETNAYSITVPAAWTPEEGDPFFTIPEDNSDKRLLHFWQDEDRLALVTLILEPLEDATFEQAVERIIEEEYINRDDLTLFETEPYPDGSFRYSYRTTDFLDALEGQLDLFFLPRGEQVVVVEMYSADAAGNDLVPTFQQILDSVTIPG